MSEERVMGEGGNHEAGESWEREGIMREERVMGEGVMRAES